MLAASVIIPTRNRASSLQRTLESLSHQRFDPNDFEVIVVDDGSVVPVDSRELGDGYQISVVRQEHSGPSVARNRGARLARGELLIFLDDDCTPVEHSWLEDYVSAYRLTPAMALGGPIMSSPGAGVGAEVSDWIVRACVSHFEPRPGGGFFLPTGNVAVPAELFRRLDGFDPGFKISEDRDFLDRWLHEGYPARALANAGVVHHRQLNLLGFLKAHIYYGRGAFRFHQARRRRGSGRWSWKYLTYYLAALGRCPVRPRYLAFLFLVLWQVANLFGFLLELSEQGREEDLLSHQYACDSSDFDI